MFTYKEIPPSVSMALKSKIDPTHPSTAKPNKQTAFQPLPLDAIYGGKIFAPLYSAVNTTSEHRINAGFPPFP
jgi:hypothetical protein